MEITVSVIGILQFLLYLVVLAAIIALIYACGRGISKLKETNRDLEQAEEDVFEARLKIERADVLADGVSGPVRNIGKELAGDDATAVKVKNIAAEAGRIKSAMNDFKDAEETEEL
ncbi:MAG: hypothetical protein ACOYJH_03275 [Anaerovoracaceae bacterium]|jgi:hypothetical protein